MSDNEASGVDTHDRSSYDHDPHDHAAPVAGETGKGGKSGKWVGILVAIAGGLGILGGIFGGGLPKCDSSSARDMIGSLYTQVPLNTGKATLAELTGIAETGYDEAADVRTCRATLLDSAGTEHSVVWSITEIEEGYAYELEVQSPAQPLGGAGKNLSNG